MNFDNGEFFKNAYDVEKISIVSAVVWPATCFVYVGWVLGRWTKAMTFWKVDQKSSWDLETELDLIETSIHGSHYDARSVNGLGQSRNMFLSPPSFNSRRKSFAMRDSFLAEEMSSQRRLSQDVDGIDRRWRQAEKKKSLAGKRGL